MGRTESLTRINKVESRILVIRGKKVMLDRDLAELYGVETKVLKQAVRRNRDRFPEDFMFQLSWDEARAIDRRTALTHDTAMSSLRSQSVTLKQGAHIKFRPYAFTEQGVAMLSSVLRSKRAVQVNIEIMRAFVRLRGVLAAHADLAKKLEELQQRVGAHDEAIRSLVLAIRNLIEDPPPKGKGRIGFLPGEEPSDK